MFAKIRIRCRAYSNSINIGLGGQFASWAGTLIPIGTPVAIAADTNEQVDEAVMRMARIGMETVKGFILLKDFDGEMNKVEQVSVEQAKEATAKTACNSLMFAAQPNTRTVTHRTRLICRWIFCREKLTKSIPTNRPTLFVKAVIVQVSERASWKTPDSRKFTM